MAAAGQKLSYNFLGKSGLQVSNICLGTMAFGNTPDGPMDTNMMYSVENQTNEATGHMIMDKFVEYGGNFIETANVYKHGDSEKIVGRWLQKQQRDSIVLATKVRFPLDWSTANDVGLSRRNVVQSLEESLERLQTNYIDLYQAHAWDNATPIRETVRTFHDLVRCGKIRYYGFSNLCGWMLQKVVDTTKLMGFNACVSLQQQYSLLRRESELDAFLVCENEGIGIMPWSPLKAGLLTGKFKRPDTRELTGTPGWGMQTALPEGQTVMSSWDEFRNDENYWGLLGVMAKIGQARDKPVTQVALRWVLQKHAVSSVIVRLTSIAQLEANVVPATCWTLTPEEMAELDEASRRMLPHPYDLNWGMPQVSRFNPYNTRVKH